MATFEVFQHMSRAILIFYEKNRYSAKKYFPSNYLLFFSCILFLPFIQVMKERIKDISTLLYTFISEAEFFIQIFVIITCFTFIFRENIRHTYKLFKITISIEEFSIKFFVGEVRVIENGT